jgi:cell division protease FtsH
MDVTSSRRRFASHLRPDLLRVVETAIQGFGVKPLGVHQPHEFVALRFSDLLIREGQSVMALSPLQYEDIDVGEAEPFPCLNNGLWLFQVEGTNLAIFLSQFFDYRDGGVTQIEVVHRPGETSGAFARAFLDRVERAASASGTYRGKVLSFEQDPGHAGMAGTMRVHRLPAVRKDEVVLSEATMARLETHVFEFDRLRDGLRRLGQSTRKGILLYGPPGTGKTHVIRYVAANLPDRTTILVTAEQMQAVRHYLALARSLQPSIVVFEDVDLIGRNRDEIGSQRAEGLLNRLLNEMDGLGPDADMLFLLTTNRPDDIEETLAQRPGRVDEAIEVPLPDADCRKRLIVLYGHALSFEDRALADAVARSEGGSAAFMKEIVRRLAQRALARGGERVSVDDVAAVLGDSDLPSNPLNRRIVGISASRGRSRRADETDSCCG